MREEEIDSAANLLFPAGEGGSIVMVRKRALLFLVAAIGILVSSCQTAPAPKKIMSRYEGQFVSTNGATGSLTLVFYQDGTFSSVWNTEIKNRLLQLDGFFVIKGDAITLSALGNTTLRPEVEARVLLNAEGKTKGKQMKGEYRISLENSKFPDDLGGWEATQIGS